MNNNIEGEMNLEIKEFEMKLRVVREVYYDNERRSGIYACVPVNYDHTEELIYNRYRNLSLAGQTRRLAQGEEYVIKFDGLHPNKNPRFDDNYHIIEVEPEKLDTVEEQDKFLQAIITENQFYSLKNAYPEPHLLVDLILDDKIDVNKTKGIKSATLSKIKELIQQNAKISVLIAKLNSLNLTTRAIDKLMAHFNTSEAVLEAIEENIYNLCQVPQFGFKTVDKSAMARGDNPTNENRIKACLTYVLEQDNNSGHTWSLKSSVLEESEKLLQINPQFISDALEKLKNTKELYVDENRVALPHIRRQEIAVNRHLWRLRNSYVTPSIERVANRIEKVEEEQGFKFTEEQKNTIINSSQDGVAVINGGAGTGKCVHGESLVLTDNGMIEIEDIPRYYNVDEDDKSSATISSYDLNGKRESRNTSHFFNMGKHKTIKIKTSQGYEIEGTPEHPVVIINSEGNLEFKKISDMKKNDVVAISKGDSMFGKSNLLTEEIAYFLGLIVGDGYTNSINSNAPSHRVLFSNGNQNVFNKFVEIAEKNFSSTVRINKDRGSMVCSVSGKETYQTLSEKYDMPICLSPEKYIPKTVLTSPKEVVSSFLRGLFDTDGGFHRYSFEFSTASRKMALQVHTLLLNYGIIAKKREKIVKNYPDRVYYILTISDRTSLEIFEREIGFLHEENKKKALNDFMRENEGKIINPNVGALTHLNEKIRDVHKYLLENDPLYQKKTGYKACISSGQPVYIMHFKDNRLNKRGVRKGVNPHVILKVLEHYGEDIPHYEYLKNICENIFVDFIEAVEESENVVYDFTVPVTHSFVANGFINHNTTIVKGLINTLGIKDDSYMASALSGKAANILNMSGVSSSTIHRMLKYDGSGFKYDEENQMHYDLVIVDEASMVNIGLFLSVLRATPNGSKLLIVGDSGQLPAIGYGDLLYDMLSTRVFPTYELTQVHRQAGESGILELATAIRSGKQIAVYGSSGRTAYGAEEDQTVITYSEDTKGNIPYDVLRIAQGYKEKVKKPEDLLDFQVFVTNRVSGALSVQNMNIELQKIFNGGASPSLSRNNYNFKKDDKIISIGNSYKLKSFEDVNSYYEFMENLKYLDAEEKEEMMQGSADVYNGTTGIIKGVDVENKVVFIQFEGINGLIAYSLTDLDNIYLAYAISVHRGQGSGVKNIIVAIDYSSYMLLSRQLVYTALTRAISKGLLLAENNALHTALQRDANTRQTFLKELLLESAEESKKHGN